MSTDAKKALRDGALKGEGDGSKLVMYLRGDRSESGKAFREQLQSAVIGHIINSQPVYIGAPVDRGYRYLPAAFGNTPSGAKSYTAYVAQKVARSCSTVLQGGAAKVCGPIRPRMAAARSSPLRPTHRCRSWGPRPDPVSRPVS